MNAAKNDLAGTMARRSRAAAPDHLAAIPKAQQKAPEGPTKRLSVDLPADTMKKLKLLSVQREVTIREIIIDVLDEHLRSGN